MIRIEMLAVGECLRANSLREALRGASVCIKELTLGAGPRRRLSGITQRDKFTAVRRAWHKELIETTTRRKNEFALTQAKRQYP